AFDRHVCPARAVFGDAGKNRHFGPSALSAFFFSDGGPDLFTDGAHGAQRPGFGSIGERWELKRTKSTGWYFGGRRARCSCEVFRAMTCAASPMKIRTLICKGSLIPGRRRSPSIRR